MFIELQGKDGIYKTGLCVGNTAGLTSYSRFQSGAHLNLMVVHKVYFGKLSEEDIKFSVKIVGDHPSWSEIVGINYIAFYIPNGESDSSFTLFFEDCAMGEYQRIKRIIDEKTWR